MSSQINVRPAELVKLADRCIDWAMDLTGATTDNAGALVVASREQVVTVNGQMYDVPPGNEIVIRAGEGNDRVSGGTDRDYIDAQGGNDLATGAGGDDTVYGMAGNDRISGGRGQTTSKAPMATT